MMVIGHGALAVGYLLPWDGAPDCGKKMDVASSMDVQEPTKAKNRGFGACTWALWPISRRVFSWHFRASPYRIVIPFFPKLVLEN